MDNDNKGNFNSISKFATYNHIPHHVVIVYKWLILRFIYAVCILTYIYIIKIIIVVRGF